FCEQMMEASRYNVEIYAQHFNTDTQILFNNDDHHTEASLPTGQHPTTREEVDEYGHKLDIVSDNDETIEPIGYYPLIGADTPVWITNALGQNYVTENREISIDVPDVKETFDWILSTQSKYGKKQLDSINSQFENAQQDPFMAGSLSMMVQNANYYVEL